ncbi:FMN-dependent NADH-azoreductase [Colwellia echini]|uniref:FMN dependent NADH:quinone oxidoreductase n=1 Tax=Colwellia echini TaxID=1982103 RepID=A0ABY3MU63_9GAMM|nr:FMN-dependent NADH-azoreductase [Colwellia echini]TYK64647.1 FMN-dependent NADH-azoreductase [Colwellia echini]
MKILHIDSSILGEHSVSRALTAATLNHFQNLAPEAEVISRDLVAEPLEHLSAVEYMAMTGNDVQVESAQASISNNAQLVYEFLASDIIIIGAPMYNFTIPSQLKSWLDRLAVAGKTFSYTENGPQGLAGGKKVIIASSRGGAYGEENAADHQESYLRVFLGFLGLTDIEFIRAEGVASDREKSVETALNTIKTLSLS